VVLVLWADTPSACHTSRAAPAIPLVDGAGAIRRRVAAAPRAASSFAAPGRSAWLIARLSSPRPSPARGGKAWAGGAVEVAGRVVQVLEETSGNARTFARKFCVSGRFLDLSWRPARTFPLSGWPEFQLTPEGLAYSLPEVRAFGPKFRLSPEGLNNPGGMAWAAAGAAWPAFHRSSDVQRHPRPLPQPQPRPAAMVASSTHLTLPHPALL
jgi:hypothetical protein